MCSPTFNRSIYQLPVGSPKHKQGTNKNKSRTRAKIDTAILLTMCGAFFPLCDIVLRKAIKCYALNRMPEKLWIPKISLCFFFFIILWVVIPTRTWYVCTFFVGFIWKTLFLCFSVANTVSIKGVWVSEYDRDRTNERTLECWEFIYDMARNVFFLLHQMHDIRINWWKMSKFHIHNLYYTYTCT